MKASAAITALLALSGCGVLGGGLDAPTRLADGSSGGMWSMRPVADVQACIAKTLNGTIDGSRVQAGPVIYQIDAVSDKHTVYTTRVSIIGDGGERHPDLALCLVPATGAEMPPAA